MLQVSDLKASVAQQEILRGVNLQINAGEVHAIMGPNGSGKSTFSKVIVGDDNYSVDSGSILYKQQDLSSLSVAERAQQGIFLGFQYPVEISGVNNLYFLRTAYNALRVARGEAECDAVDFLNLYKKKAALLDMDKKYQQRAVNAGFSGGEKKRNEILQMLILEPELVLLDETDSGLDIDALQTIAAGINYYRSSDKSIVLVTHYQRLLDYITPDYVHVMLKGRIVKSGGPELALKLEKDGYAWLEESAVVEG